MSLSGSEQRQNLSRLLRAMIDTYRLKNPMDERNDPELLEDLMGYFHDAGCVGKTEAGKWILPRMSQEDFDWLFQKFLH